MTITNQRPPADLLGTPQLRAVPDRSEPAAQVDRLPAAATPGLSLVPPAAEPTGLALVAPDAGDVVRALLLESGTGDKAAFARLYDVVIPVVMAAARLLSAPGQAEAVAERACVDVWRWAPGYARSGASPVAWITARVEQAAAAVAATG